MCLGRHDGAAGLVSPERLASGEWIPTKMPPKSQVSVPGAMKKEFGAVMLGPRHRCELQLTVPSGAFSESKALACLDD